MSKSDDLISRQAAIDILATMQGLRTSKEALIQNSKIWQQIKDLPSAQPKTGRWVKATGMMPPEFHGHHCCSECGQFANMEPPFGNREGLSKFCPNCGAYMGGKDNE